MHIGIALVTVIDQGVKYFYKLLPVHSGILQFRTEFSCVFPEHPVTLRNMQAQFLQGMGRLQRGERLLLQTERERGERPRYRSDAATHKTTNPKNEKIMAKKLHVAKLWQIEYKRPGMSGSTGQDALYRILRMFDVDNSAEDICTDEFVLRRSGLQ